MMRRLNIMTIGLVAAVLLASNAPAAETKKTEMNPEMQAQMEKIKEMGSPGPEHAILKPLVGKWKVSSVSWMKPGDKEEKSTGTSTMSMELGGRFLKQTYNGKMGKEPFNGIGYFGYDKMKKAYVTTWMDSISTGLLVSNGQYDPATKTISDSGTFSCPMTGESDKWFRSEWKIGEKNKQIYTMYTKDGEGNEFKTMELTYTRSK